MTMSPTRRRGARAALLAPVVAAGLVVGLGAGPTAQAAAPAKSGIYYGVAGDQQTPRTKTGESLAGHDYGFFEEKQVPSGRMVTVRFRSNPPWRQTANLKSGSADYQNVVRWADALKARGANNISFAFQSTSYAYHAKSSAYNAIAKWYPGDAYVDVVAPDPYNWFNCGHGRGKWNSLKSLVEPAVAFARSHGKQIALAEYASVRDSRRAAWIKDAGTYMAANDDVFVAAFYFNRNPTNSANSDCTWPLSSSADFAALKEVAKLSVMQH
jgi:hypothetical protein